jgi:hypothetical protein
MPDAPPRQTNDASRLALQDLTPRLRRHYQPLKQRHCLLSLTRRQIALPRERRKVMGVVLGVVNELAHRHLEVAIRSKKVELRAAKDVVPVLNPIEHVRQDDAQRADLPLLRSIRRGEGGAGVVVGAVLMALRSRRRGADRWAGRPDYGLHRVVVRVVIVILGPPSAPLHHRTRRIGRDLRTQPNPPSGAAPHNAYATRRVNAARTRGTYVWVVGVPAAPHDRAGGGPGPRRCS